MALELGACIMGIQNLLCAELHQGAAPHPQLTEAFALTSLEGHVGTGLCPAALPLQLDFGWNGDDPRSKRQNKLCPQLRV